MLTADNIARRGRLITATDCAALLGVSPYKTALDVYADKVIGREAVDNEAVEIGQLLEDDILELASRRLAVPVLPNSDLVVCDAHPWLAATPDGYAISPETGNEFAVVEAKHSADRAAWRDGVPEHYRVQVQVQLLCTGCRMGYVASLVGNAFALFEVLSDAETHMAIIEASRAMMDAVAAGVPPEADYRHPRAIDAVRRVAGHTPRLERDIAGVADAVARYTDAKARAEAADADRKAAQAEIEAALGDAGIGLLPGYRVTKSQRTRTTYDVPANVQEQYPAKVSTYFAFAVKQTDKKEDGDE